MKILPRRRKPHRNPEQVIRAFLRTLERLAPQPPGGPRMTPGVAREKP